MKAFRLTFRALLLISLLSPFGLRAFGSRIGTPSCHVPTPASAEDHQDRAGSFSLDSVLAVPPHRSPAHRTHRLRGKRISVDTSFVLVPTLPPLTRQSFSAVTLHIRDLDGPNPSRGPPAPSL